MADLASATAIAAPEDRARGAMPWDVRIAAAFLVAIVLLAVLADWVAPYDYAVQDLRARLRPPVFLGGAWDHPLGTDNLGRDILSRLIYGAQTSILIAVGGTLVGFVIGTTLGFVAAHARGLVEEAVLLLVDVQAALPYIVVALAALAFFGNNLVLFIVLIGMEGWERYARLSRGLVLSAKEGGYVGALQGIGAPPGRIYLRHVLPNIASALVVQLTLNFPNMILLETSISFLGLGVQPPMTSLGLMLGQGRLFLLNAWWIAVLPGIVIFLTTMAISLFGDWLRDWLDPTLEERG